MFRPSAPRMRGAEPFKAAAAPRRRRYVQSV